MTFGVVLLAGIIVLYILALLSIYNSPDFFEIFKNFSTIIGTGFTTIIAFYFGSRGSQSAFENTKKSSPVETTKNRTIPSVLKTKPFSNAENIHINTDICAKFNESMEATSINKTTFTIVNSKNNEPVDGEISLIEKNTKALFKTSNLTYSAKYIATIESEVTDIEGNPMMQDKIWVFTTGDKEQSTQTP